MALSKQIIASETGATTNYHKIFSVFLKNNHLYVDLKSYTSKEYRDNGSCISETSYTFKITIEEEESMGVRQLAYKKLKELPEWKDAEDC